jgi:(5-formylfuran-3-yl)methyl phosphate synthase
MTLLLASVTSAEEAEIVLSHGADVIDLKDADNGPLGALTTDVVRAAVAAVAGRRSTSAVTGNVPMQPDAVASAVAAMAGTGVDYVKVGLFPGPDRADCIRALSALARKTKIVGVMFADQGADEALLAAMATSGFAGAMLDTAGKAAGRLLDHADIASLGTFVDACRRQNLLAGLAGSLEPPDIPRLLLVAPDYLGFRRALCVNLDRAARIDPEMVSMIRELIPVDPRSLPDEGAGAAKVDYRLLAARGYAVDPKDAPTDRVFVRDFVLPVRIGAYAREHEKPQRIRFDIDVAVLRLGRAATDMRDVFSYDVITDGIRMIVAREHIALIETLAERIAAMLLAHARVMRVTVRVEKLELGAGGVGVEITRERPAEAADVRHLYPVAARESDPKAAD